VTDASASLSSTHVDAARARLANLGGLADKTTHAERAILQAADDRRAAIQADIEKLRPRVNLDQAAADQYQALILERGQLDTVAAQSRAALLP
jgi:hypothetical protein